MNTLQFPRPATDHSHTAKADGPMRHDSVHDVVEGYLELQLKGKASYSSQRSTASQWLLTIMTKLTRKQIVERHKLKGHDHFEKGCSQANTELALLRAAIRWGLYNETWEGDDPTVGITKWKTKKRKRVCKHEEIKALLTYFEAAQTAEEIRNRALFGLMFFTGCRPIEARTALLTSIMPYGEMGCWNKGTTKNGEEYEVPVPKQYMAWLAAWKAIRPSARPNPYLFPGREFESCLTADMVDHLWHDLRLTVQLPGLWNYDLRRSLATHMSNELNYSDAKIDAILGHEKTSSLGHYLHVSFDAMTGPIQHYADWLWVLRQDAKGAHQEPALASMTPAVPVPPTPPLSQPMIARPIVTGQEDKKRLHSLSEREYDTLARLGQGQSCTDIATGLGLSIKTVRTYRARLLRKLHVSSTADLIRYAITHKVEPTPLVTRPPETVIAEDDEIVPLTEREYEILVWFAHGQSCAYIGARLGIATTTVETYRARLLDKLHLTTTTDLIRYAIEHQVDMTLPIPAQPKAPPVSAPVVMRQIMPAPVPIACRSHAVEREEWPG